MSRPHQTHPPGEPEVIRRLPSGVEYTFIKMIVSSAPPTLTTLLWASNSIPDPLWEAFRRKSYRAIDRELEKLEKTAVTEEDRERVAGLRFEWIKHLIGEPFPPWFRKRFRIVFSTAGAQIQVHKVSRKKGATPLLEETLFEEQRISSEPRFMGGTTVNWLNFERVNKAAMLLLGKHHFLIPEVMRGRTGRAWRTKRSPEGWPLVDRYLVPAMYDYLKPFYPARPYHRLRKLLTMGGHLERVIRVPAAGDYPRRLLQDITDLIKCELPHLGKDLTIRRVKAAIQRYLERALRNRPMGKDIFRA